MKLDMDMEKDQSSSQKLQELLERLKQAIAQNPNSISDHLNLSNVYIALNEHEKAKQHLYQTLRLDPHHAEGYNNLGRLFYKENLFSEAIPLFEKALRINPDYWEAHYNLAHSLTKQNQTSRAMVHYKEVLRLKPEHAFAHYNLGLLLFEAQLYIDAEAHLKQAINFSFKEPLAWYYLAHSQLALGKMKESAETFEKLIQEKELIASDWLAESYHNLAVLYLGLEEKTKALDYFEKTLDLQPKNDTARHMITALKGMQSSSEAPQHYIAELFDQYADYYDEHVKQDLKYVVPGLLRNAVGQCLTNLQKRRRVLDIGCGTGLCGVYFSDLAFKLIGIDLSPKMVEKAKVLGAYDEVICGDYNDYLKNVNLRNEHCDLIIAADVFVYTGDLSKVFQNVEKALNVGGLFAFTVETLETASLETENLNKDYFLQPTGRFAHAANYIHKLASEGSWTIEKEESIILRENQGKPIPGILFVLEKIRADLVTQPSF